jgi:hypothetical protein
MIGKESERRIDSKCNLFTKHHATGIGWAVRLGSVRCDAVRFNEEDE